jgi:hypothetical protein
MTFSDTRKNIAADSDPTSAVQLTKLAIGIQMKTINPFVRIALTNAPAQGRYFDFSSCRKYSNTAFRNPLTFARLHGCVRPFTETQTRNTDSLIGRVLRARNYNGKRYRVSAALRLLHILFSVSFSQSSTEYARYISEEA